MVYEIVYTAIEKKITLFEKPAPLINVNEVAAALSIGYRQLGLPKPEIHVGDSVNDLRAAFLSAAEGSDRVTPNLIVTLKDYPYGEKTITEDARATYEFA